MSDTSRAGNPPAKYPDNNPKTQFGLKKPSMACVPLTALWWMARAMEFGAYQAGDGTGYGPFNWRSDGAKVATKIYTDAIRRHLDLYEATEEKADDSLILHLAHIMASCAILIDAKYTGNLVDDRNYGSNIAALKQVWTDIQHSKKMLEERRTEGDDLEN